MAKRKKIKKKVLYIGIAILVILTIASVKGYKMYKQYLYEQTYEYKLTEHGYTLEETKKLLKFYQKEEDREYLLNHEKNTYILELIDEKYFINKNLERYLAYYKENKNTEVKDVIAIVNVNRDYNYYEHDIESDTTKRKLLIVNKYYKLTKEFQPEELTKINTQYAYDGNAITKEALDAYISMWQEAKNSELQLIINSSYRDYQEQEDVYKRFKASYGEREADKVAARPGHSEHQSGLAIDVFEINNQSTKTFEESPAYTWLKENAYRFGFIERYPKEKEYLTGYSFESWHWRYVGTEAAKIIQEENITYDEYYAYYIENND